MNKSYSKAKILRLSGVAFLLGIIFGFFLKYKFLIFLVIFLCIFLRRKFPPLVVFIFILSLIIGFLRYNWALEKTHFKIAEEKLIEYPLVVVLSEEFDSYQKLTVKPKGIKNFQGGIIYTDLKPTYLKGEVIKINKGKITIINTPYYQNGLFICFKVSYSEIIKINSNSFSVLASLLKNKIKNIFDRYLKKSQADLLSSLVFGRKGNLNKELEEELNLSGLSHLVAVSGLHLLILTQIIVNFLDRFSLQRFIKAIILLFLLSFFAYLVGFTPSIVRALLMAIILIFADLNFRIYHPLNALIFTALIMTFLNPFILIYDLGFQLSFLATLGIIIFLPVFRQNQLFNTLKVNSFLNNFKEAFLTSLSALILVYPWLIFKIGRISALALLTNMLVVPLVPYILILALGLIIVSPLYLLALFVGWFLNILLSYILVISNIFSSFRLFIISFPPFFRMTSLSFYILVFFYYLKYKKEQLFLNKNL